MKKVLIIYIYFLQENFIGTVRMRGLAKYLYDFGWEATILTAKLPNTSETFQDTHIRIIETPYESLFIRWEKRLGLKTNKSFKELFHLQRHKDKKTIRDIIANSLVEIIAYPDSERMWYKTAIDAVNKLMKQESFDAIISSSPPATHHLIGSELKKRYGIPWIADLRDPWTQDHYYPYSFIRRFIERRLELRTLSRADAIVIVSQPLAEKQKEFLHNRKTVHVILNGFNPEQKKISPSLSDKFNIVYTGKMLGGKRDPEPLFKAIQKLISEGVIKREDIAVDFYGDHSVWLERDIKKYGLQDIIKMHGLIPREDSLEKQRNTQVLLLLTWNDLNEKGVHTGKIFDYLSAQRPILSIGMSGGVVKELLSETNAGIHASTQKEIEETLKSFYYEFKSNGRVGYDGIDSEVNKYSQKEMAGKFAAVLNTIVQR